MRHNISTETEKLPKIFMRKFCALNYGSTTTCEMMQLRGKEMAPSSHTWSEIMPSAISPLPGDGACARWPYWAERGLIMFPAMADERSSDPCWRSRLGPGITSSGT